MPNLCYLGAIDIFSVKIINLVSFYEQGSGECYKMLYVYYFFQ